MGNINSHAVSIAARALTAGTVATCLCACGAATIAEGASPTRVPSPVAAAPPTALDTALAEATQAWEARWDPASLDRAIASWQRSLTLPGATSQEVQLRLAEAHHFRGTAILSRQGDAEAALAAFEAGVQAATAAGAEDLEAAPSEALYWWASNRAAAASQTDFAGSVLVQRDVVSVMLRCAEANCSYDHGGAHRFLGSHHARPLGFSHRDLPRARSYFDRAIAGDPTHLPTRVAFARDYAVAAQDRSLFEQQVRFVVEASPEPRGPSRGDVQLAQHQAAALLRDAPNLFE